MLLRWALLAVLGMAGVCRAVVENPPADAERVRFHVERLCTGSSEVRQEAIGALEAMGEPAAQALQKVLDGKPNAKVRAVAERALALVRPGKPAGGWQAALTVPKDLVFLGRFIPLNLTLKNRSTERDICVPVTSLRTQDPENLYVLEPGEACLIVHAERKPGNDNVEAHNEQRLQKLGQVVKPGAVETFNLGLVVKTRTADLQQEIRAEEFARCEVTLSPGTHAFQVLYRPNADAPLLATERVKITFVEEGWPEDSEASREAEGASALVKDREAAARLREALARLDDEDPDAREAATRTLVTGGWKSAGFLKDLLKGQPSLEAALRANSILGEIRWNEAEGGPPVAAYRATLRCARREFRKDEDVKLSFEVRNISKEEQPFVRVNTLNLSSPFIRGHFSSARATIEIRRKDSPGEAGEYFVADMEHLREDDTVRLKPGASHAKTVMLEFGNKPSESEALPVDAPFECACAMTPGEYAVRVVYHARSRFLISGAEDDLYSNWVFFKVLGVLGKEDL